MWVYHNKSHKSESSTWAVLPCGSGLLWRTMTLTFWYQPRGQIPSFTGLLRHKGILSVRLKNLNLEKGNLGAVIASWRYQGLLVTSNLWKKCGNAIGDKTLSGPLEQIDALNDHLAETSTHMFFMLDEKVRGWQQTPSISQMHLACCRKAIKFHWRPLHPDTRPMNIPNHSLEFTNELDSNVTAGKPPGK